MAVVCCAVVCCAIRGQQSPWCAVHPYTRCRNYLTSYFSALGNVYPPMRTVMENPNRHLGLLPAPEETHAVASAATPVCCDHVRARGPAGVQEGPPVQQRTPTLTLGLVPVNPKVNRPPPALPMTSNPPPPIHVP